VQRRAGAGAAFSRPQRLPRTTRQVQLEVQITPATRALLVTVLLAPGSLVHWSTRGVRALVDARRCRCWHGCSRAGQRSRHENTTPGAPPAARSETAHSQKYYNTVDQGTSEALKRFGGAVRGVQRKSSARRHQIRAVFIEKALKIELPNQPAAHARQQTLVP